MLRENLHFEEVIFRVDGLVVYSGLKKNAIITELKDICASVCFDKDLKGINEKYFNFAAKLVEIGEEYGFTGNLLAKYAVWMFINDVNAFSLACERGLEVKSSTLYRIALKDVGMLKYLMDFDLKNICENLGYGEKLYDYNPVEPVTDTFIDQVATCRSESEILEKLIWYYGRMGCGDFSQFKMYKFDEEFGLTGIKNSDRVEFSDIIGCGAQKTQIMENTEAFLKGAEANNLLLVGARGTGKSSCVKALANHYFDKGLRLIEIHKDQAKFLPGILRSLVGRGKKFIIFIDDLSYDDFEIQYKYLKSVMEGSAEIRPSNVLFYATSNRRNIVQEKWSERPERLERLEYEEVHNSDAMNEKLSLSDRFGLTVSFPKPDPGEYLNIVIGLAKKEKINVPEDFLKEQALKWELNQNGMSGRTARQFINHIKWELMTK